MGEVNRYVVDCNRLWKSGKLQTEVDVSVILSADFDRVTAERDALQALLTAADDRADVLEGLLREIRQSCELSKLRDAQIDAALKPAEGGGDAVVRGSLSDKALSLIDEEIRSKGLPS